MNFTRPHTLAPAHSGSPRWNSTRLYTQPGSPDLSYATRITRLKFRPVPEWQRFVEAVRAIGRRQGDRRQGLDLELGKGAALGTTLAFMMSVIALSLPEMIILRKVLTLRLIAVFVGVVGTGVLAVDFLFNMLFH